MQNWQTINKVFILAVLETGTNNIGAMIKELLNQYIVLRVVFKSEFAHLNLVISEFEMQMVGPIKIWKKQK